jgi:hypothetical protein
MIEMIGAHGRRCVAIFIRVIYGMPSRTTPCTAFIAKRRLAHGTLADVVLRVKEAGDKDPDAQILVFDDATGRVIDVDTRGTPEEIVARIPRAENGNEATPPARGPGRPRLGVVGREVTLLPRHWEWLGSQRGGASAALRRLVEEAHLGDGGRERVRQA